VRAFSSSTAICDTASTVSGTSCSVSTSTGAVTLTFTPSTDLTNKMLRFYSTTDCVTRCTNAVTAVSTPINIHICYSPSHTISVDTPEYSSTYDCSTTSDTIDLSTWFTASDSQCPIQEYYITTSPAYGSAQGAPHVSVGGSPSQIVIDYAAMCGDATITNY
jgi:hypothetical protein